LDCPDGVLFPCESPLLFHEPNGSDRAAAGLI
jgi:hypothetical protein